MPISTPVSAIEHEEALAPLAAEVLPSSRRRRNRSDAWRRFRQNKAAVVGLVIVVILALIAIFAPLLAPDDPLVITGHRLEPPGTGYGLLGTDQFGRDMFSRVVYGARTSMTVGFLAALVSSVVGVTIGSLAGYFGGVVDAVLMRITEAAQVVPSFFVAILIVSFWGTGVSRIILVIGLLAWPHVARTTRAMFLQLRETEFVEAARALGYRGWRIMFREILPNAATPIIVLLSLDIAQAVLIEASLGFVGLSDATQISWGEMLSDAEQYLTDAWWLSVVPGVAIFLLVMGVNLLGDGINDAIAAD